MASNQHLDALFKRRNNDAMKCKVFNDTNTLLFLTTIVNRGNGDEAVLKHQFSNISSLVEHLKDANQLYKCLQLLVFAEDETPKWLMHEVDMVRCGSHIHSNNSDHLPMYYEFLTSTGEILTFSDFRNGTRIEDPMQLKYSNYKSR